MNFGRTLQYPLARVPGKQQQQPMLEDWRSLLVACQRKPSRRHVHELRVATLRLQARLDKRFEWPEADFRAGQAARHWNKAAGKLRDDLSAVRDIDVYRGKLSLLRGTLATPEGYTPRSSRASLRQIETLDGWLARERKIAAKKLISDLRHRQSRLERVSGELESAQASGYSLAPTPFSSGIFKIFADAVAEFPKLDAGCLHDFRKRIKNIRYLAELFAETEPQARRQAETLRAMQGAVGEWHDWQELTRLAAGKLRKRRAQGSLISLLESESEESLQKALETCRIQTAQLLGDLTSDTSRMQLVGKKTPVRRQRPPKIAPMRVVPAAVLDEQRLA